MTYPYSFKDCLNRSERIAWRVEDLIGDGKTLDFSRPFMAESLAFVRAHARPFINGEDYRAPIQKRANHLTYIGSRKSHPRFLETLGELSPRMRQRIEEAAALA